ncbi:hypothetical protein D3C86_1269830 [compost metagenome]
MRAAARDRGERSPGLGERHPLLGALALLHPGRGGRAREPRRGLRPGGSLRGGRGHPPRAGAPPSRGPERQVPPRRDRGHGRLLGRGADLLCRAARNRSQPPGEPPCPRAGRPGPRGPAVGRQPLPRGPRRRPGRSRQPLRARRAALLRRALRGGLPAAQARCGPLARRERSCRLRGAGAPLRRAARRSRRRPRGARRGDPLPARGRAALPRGPGHPAGSRPGPPRRRAQGRSDRRPDRPAQGRSP